MEEEDIKEAAEITAMIINSVQRSEREAFNDSLAAYHDKCERLEEENRKLREGMKRLEWIYDRRLCPACFGIDPAQAKPFDKYPLKIEECGHSNDCWLSALIRGDKGD